MVTQLPFDPFAAHREFARVTPHCGRAIFRFGETTIVGDAEFLLPAAGHAIIALHTGRDITSQDFGQDFVLEGTGEHGTFRIQCPQVYVRRPVPSDSTRECSLVSPVNAPTLIEYGAQRLITRVTALLNNFDYTTGDAVGTENGGFTRLDTPVVLTAGDRQITVRHRSDRAHLLPMVQAGILRSTSLVELAFDVNASESDDAVMALCNDAGAILTFAAGTAVNVAMLDMVDARAGWYDASCHNPSRRVFARTAS
jgi:hypothetical protein